LNAVGGTSFVEDCDLTESILPTAILDEGETPILSGVIFLGVPGTDRVDLPFPISIGGEDTPRPAAAMLEMPSISLAGEEAAPGVSAGDGFGVGTEAVRLGKSSAIAFPTETG
jgi:hypothetical protein